MPKGSVVIHVNILIDGRVAILGVDLDVSSNGAIVSSIDIDRVPV